MYLNFNDYLICFIKSLLMSLLIPLIFFLTKINYIIGNSLCNYLNIPKNLTLTVMSPGFFVEVILILFFIEIIFVFFVIYKLSKIN